MTGTSAPSCSGAADIDPDVAAAHRNPDAPARSRLTSSGSAEFSPDPGAPGGAASGCCPPGCCPPGCCPPGCCPPGCCPPGCCPPGCCPPADPPRGPA